MKNEQPFLPGLKPFVDLKPKKQRSKKNSQYLWLPGEEPPELGEHSLAKHRIIKAYLEKYVAILAANPVVDQLNLSLVDGFSGGGVYRHPKTGERIPGSPILMLESMDFAEAKANNARQKKEFTLNTRYYFIEQQRSTIDYLKKELSLCEAAHGKGEKINMLHGQFSQHLSTVISTIKSTGRANRAIFLLDQYGYTDVTLANMRRIFRELPNAEVILTFAIDWLADFINETDSFESALRNLELEHQRDLLLKLRQEHANDWRPSVQHLLHQHFFEKSGADYYTPFFIHSVDSHRAYWLLHFSKHSTARNAMVDLHWGMHDHFQHFGKAGFGMLLGHDPRQKSKANQKSFAFDADAEKLTHQALLAEMPSRISVFTELVSFKHFFNAVVNETPATKEMIAKMISELSRAKEVEVFSKDRKERRAGVIIKDTDLIRLPQNKTFLPIWKPEN